MAPYDKWANDLSIIISDDVLGVHHSVCQGQRDEFEVSILAPCLKHVAEVPNPRKSRWFRDKKKAKKQKKSKGENRSVHFDEHIRIFRIPHKNDVTPQEKSVLWINSVDWEVMQNEKQRITRAVLIGEMSIENPDHRPMLRGLETIVPALAFNRRENVQLARSIVLREQTQARLEDLPLDANRVAECYGSIVQGSRKAAYERAIEDYCEVLKDNNTGNKLSLIV